MADELDLQEIVRRTVQANARLYRGWVDLSLEYFRGIADIFGGVPEAASSPAEEFGGGAGAVVLEGEEGSPATAAFLVTNDLGRSISCSLVTSGFRDPDGNSVRVNVAFDPPKFDLPPGQQTAVRVTVPIDRSLVEGVAYSGEFSIDGMEGFSVPVVIRRQHQVETSPIDRTADGHTEKGESKGKGAASGRRTGAKASETAGADTAGTATKASRKKTAGRKATRRKTPRKKTGRKSPRKGGRTKE